MSAKQQWTAAEVAKVVKALRTASTNAEGVAAVSAALPGKSLSWDGIRNIVRTRTGELASSYLKPTPVVVHPVAAAEARAAARSDKNTIADLVAELREAKARQKFLDDTSGGACPKIIAREKRSGIREMTAVVLCSDLHVEEPVVPESVGGINEYNMAIADARLKRLFAGVRWNVEHHRCDGHLKIRDLVLWLGGDFMSGFIHDDLVQSNELSPVETSLWLMPRIRSGIMTLLNDLDLASLVIPCSYGNHGRTTAKTRVQNGASNSYEWLFYRNLAAHFDNEPRVRFEITQSPHQYVQVYGKTLHFHHGDSVRSLGGVGGISVPLLRAMPRWDAARFADLHHVGHFHTYSDFGRLMVNGSLIGFGPFSQWIGAQPEPPQQLSYLLDSKRGKCQVSPIWVGEDVRKVAA